MRNGRPGAGSPESELRLARVGVVPGVILAFLLSCNSPSRVPKAATPTPLPAEGEWALDPAVSPDGRTLVYASDRNGDGIVHLWARPFRERTTAYNVARAACPARSGGAPAPPLLARLRSKARAPRDIRPPRSNRVPARTTPPCTAATTPVE